MTKATWKNGKRTLTGVYSYHYPSDRFTILLDSMDRVTGQQRRLVVAGDTPEWGNWKLVRNSQDSRGGK